ncbi:hypothetical protein D3C72_2466250 [compost metagenome]
MFDTREAEVVSRVERVRQRDIAVENRVAVLIKIAKCPNDVIHILIVQQRP